MNELSCSLQVPSRITVIGSVFEVESTTVRICKPKPKPHSQTLTIVWHNQQEFANTRTRHYITSASFADGSPFSRWIIRIKRRCTKPSTNTTFQTVCTVWKRAIIKVWCWQELVFRQKAEGFSVRYDDKKNISSLMAFFCRILTRVLMIPLGFIKLKRHHLLSLFMWGVLCTSPCKCLVSIETKHIGILILSNQI